jgi:Phosphopantetheine attachment site
MISEADVRAVLERALGDPRLASVSVDKPLLRSGVITSIELVGVLVDLERHFGEVIPESAAPQMSIASILRALGGTAGAARGEPEPQPDAMVRRLRRAVRRPVLFVVSVAVCLFFLELAVRGLVEGPLAADYREFVEGGRRFYPFSGSFSQDSFHFALGHHEISAAPPADALRVGVFGDCGTMGSFVPAADAIPARLEASLRAQGTPAKVYNLAWYGRLLPKDFMLLELVWDRPLDVVVFTLSEDHLRRSTTAAWIDVYRHITFNWELFDRFQDRLPASERAPFRDVLGRLRRADVIHQGPLRRWEYERFALLPYQPFLRYLVTVRWLPGPFASSMREDMTAVGQRRVALSDPPPRMPPELTSADLDGAQLKMLRAVIRLLQRRGVRVLLYAEPVAPREWRVDRALTAASLAAKLARETGCLFVDQSWALGTGDFIDSLAHFTPDANRRIGEALAQAIRSRD